MKSRKPRNISEKFSLEDWALVEGMRQMVVRNDDRSWATGHYEAFQLYKPHRYFRSVLSSSDFATEVRADELNNCCDEILATAWEDTISRYPDWLKHEWIADDHICSKIRFTSSDRQKAVAYCKSIIKALSARNTEGFSKEQVGHRIVHVEDRLMALLNGDESSPIITEVSRAFLDAVDEDDFDLAEELLAQGADVNVIADHGSTALGEQIYSYRDYDVALCWLQFLLEHGADPNIFGYDGMLPLHWAVHMAPKVTQYLLEHGADPNINEYVEEYPWVISSPLDHAYGDYCFDSNDWGRLDEIVQLLETAGAIRTRDDKVSGD